MANQVSSVDQLILGFHWRDESPDTLEVRTTTGDMRLKLPTLGARLRIQQLLSLAGERLEVAILRYPQVFEQLQR